MYYRDDSPALMGEAIFPFMKLPSEIRNRIYKFVVLFDKLLKVEDMHPYNFKRHLKEGLCDLRTDYQFHHGKWSAHLDFTGYYFERTSYDMCVYVDDQWEKHTLAMLAVSRQTRKEAIWIFYGLNTFRFSSMCTFLAFLSDRTLEALRSLQSIELTFCPSIQGRLRRNTSAYSVSEYWNQAIKEMAGFQELRVKKLHIRLSSFEADFQQENFSADFTAPQWVHALCESTQGLDMLEISYDHRDWCEIRHDWGDVEKADIAVMGKVIDDLWGFIAPRMMKELGDNVTRTTDFSRRRIHIRSS